MVRSVRDEIRELELEAARLLHDMEMAGTADPKLLERLNRMRVDLDGLYDELKEEGGCNGDPQ